MKNFNYKNGLNDVFESSSSTVSNDHAYKELQKKGLERKMESKKSHIMIVDDDQEMRSLLQDFLSDQGYQVTVCRNGMEAVDRLQVQPEVEADLVITDVNMPEMTGLELTSRLRTLRPDLPVIVITAFGSIETAVEAMKRGAFHYIVKPFKIAEMSVLVERAIEHRLLKEENRFLKEEIKKPWSPYGIIGKSKPMQTVFDLISRVSHATANVFITGESGTGKEMVARAIHNQGPRANHPFVAINCTAIPESLLESELFGHAKGSFTGAHQKKMGLFEEANGGTLFLDEIGDMNISIQAKLLRAIQDKKIRPVGENVDHSIDVRIIAATHKDLKLAIKESRFREDLYYRLSVIPIHIPALRERIEDIPLLVDYFLKKYIAINGSQVRGLSQKAMNRLMQMQWEGNIRELQNFIERLVVLSSNEIIQLSDLPQEAELNSDVFFQNSTGDFPTIEQLELRYIKKILNYTGGRKDKTAQILGINRRTLYRKEREYGLLTDENQTEDEAIESDLDE